MLIPANLSGINGATFNMSKYKLITDLCESKVFRSRQAIDKMSDLDKQNLLYSTLLGTIAATNDPKTALWGQGYAAKTAAFGNFDHFRPSATDLYALFHVSPVGYQEKTRIIRLLKGLGKGYVNQSEVQQVLLRLERTFSKIDPRLKTARRTIANWASATPAARKMAVQNIILSTQKISRRAEVLPYMKVMRGGRRGHFGKASALKKAAALAGIGLAGFALGKRSYDPASKFEFGKRTRKLGRLQQNSIELDSGNMLAEDRATQLAFIAQKLPEHPAVEKVISVNYLADGISAFVRTTDGNAYEFEIRPARFAKGHEDKRGVTEEWEYMVREWWEDDDGEDGDPTCPYCGEEMEWCSACGEYTSRCCIEWGTCACS